MDESPKVIYRRVAHAAWRTIGGEHIVVDLKRLQMYGLNETAAYLWHRLDRTIEPAAVAEELGPHGSSGSVAVEDVSAFCHRLADLGLVDVVQRDDTLDDDPSAPGPAPPSDPSPPEILWQEEVRQGSGSCAFLPAQNPLCTSQSFS